MEKVLGDSADEHAKLLQKQRKELVLLQLSWGFPSAWCSEIGVEPT